MSKITLKTLRFSNIMSYGKDIEIRFDKDPVSQLVGRNGVGKSTIATVLEEVLYNKNSRGIKKDELLSWDSDKKEYSIELEFSKGGDEYLLTKIVKSTAKVTLIKNGEDISGHTATQTYKLLEQDILEADFATMTKLIYQSVGSSMDFLKATDANRKNFLVGLLDLRVYSEISDKLKEEKKALNSKLTFLQGKEDALTDTLRKTEVIPEFQELKALLKPTVEEFDIASQELAQLDLKIRDFESNKTLLKHYNTLFSAVMQAEKPLLGIQQPEEFDEQQYTRVKTDYQKILSLSEDTKGKYKKFKREVEGSICPTCGTHLDVSGANRAMQEMKELFVKQAAERDILKTELDRLEKDRTYYRAYTSDYKKFTDAKLKLKEFETLHDIEVLSKTPLELDFLHSQAGSLRAFIENYKKASKDISDYNIKAEKSNAIRELRIAQRKEAEESLEGILDELVELENSVAELDVAILAMKDLVSYKIEFSIKSFEDLINKYLSIMTNGKFALGFELEDTKLKVIIYNDGNRTGMENCSTGQQARINIATLLAIRMMLSSVSKVNINVLFLDEVVSFIDPEGLDILVELLNQEYDLNSIIVSHGRAHPLANKISVEIDQNGKSYIEQ